MALAKYYEDIRLSADRVIDEPATTGAPMTPQERLEMEVRSKLANVLEAHRAAQQRLGSSIAELEARLAELQKNVDRLDEEAVARRVRLLEQAEHDLYWRIVGQLGKAREFRPDYKDWYKVNFLLNQYLRTREAPPAPPTKSRRRW